MLLAATENLIQIQFSTGKKTPTNQQKHQTQNQLGPLLDL